MFRVVLQEHTKAPNSSVQEILGFLNPHTGEKELKKDRIEHWLSKGAQASERVHNMLIDEEILKGNKIRTQGKMKKAKDGEEGESESGEAKKEESKEEPKEETPAEEKPEEKKAE